MAGGVPACFPYFDEPTELGGSMEARQLSEDAARIMFHETRLCDVVDPLAGSYYIESLTDDIANKVTAVIETIDALGGAVAATKNGYIQREIAHSAYLHQQEIENGDRPIIGVNAFLDTCEQDVKAQRQLPLPYDPLKRDAAEQNQIANLTAVKSGRGKPAVELALKQVRKAAIDETANVMPSLIDAVKVYASIGEICDVLRDVFGEYKASTTL